MDDFRVVQRVAHNRDGQSTRFMGDSRCDSRDESEVDSGVVNRGRVESSKRLWSCFDDSKHDSSLPFQHTYNFIYLF